MLYRPKTSAAEAAIVALVAAGIVDQIEEAPTQAPPARLNTALVEVRTLADVERIDPVVPAGTPGTVQCPATGHVLSVARPDLDEGFMSYCRRVSAQAAGNPDTAAAVLTYGDALFDRFGGFQADGSNWPLAADRFYNLRAYMSQQERGQDDQARAQWSALRANLAVAAGTPLPLAATTKPDAPSAPTSPSIVDYYRNLPSQEAKDAVLLMIGSQGHNELIRSGAATAYDLQEATARQGGAAGIDLATGRPWVARDGQRVYVADPVPLAYRFPAKR